MNKKPNISAKFLQKINRVHASASQTYNSITPEAFESIRVKSSSQTSSSPTKMKM